MHKLCLNRIHTVYSTVLHLIPPTSQYLADSVQSVAESSRRPGVSSADFIKCCTFTEFGERCFSHAGPTAWTGTLYQTVLSSLLTLTSNEFKRLLKSHLLYPSSILTFC